MASRVETCLSWASASACFNAATSEVSFSRCAAPSLAAAAARLSSFVFSSSSVSSRRFWSATSSRAFFSAASASCARRAACATSSARATASFASVATSSRAFFKDCREGARHRNKAKAKDQSNVCSQQSSACDRGRRRTYRLQGRCALRVPLCLCSELFHLTPQRRHLRQLLAKRGEVLGVRAALFLQTLQPPAQVRHLPRLRRLTAFHVGDGRCLRCDDAVCFLCLGVGRGLLLARLVVNRETTHTDITA